MESIPVREKVQAICELLGLEALALPCEGRVLVWLPEDQVEQALTVLRNLPYGSGAQQIGSVEAAAKGSAPVRLRNALGAERPLDFLSGTDLPRIC
ncbi:MAG: hypothetical protein KAY24_09925 [Candidatus Eisenbacteria sp.]|nr:hypothetical protein [Candidatus Eisenbacteria bacterium]